MATESPPTKGESTLIFIFREPKRGQIPQEVYEYPKINSQYCFKHFLGWLTSLN
ncbi:MAG TPA: hypothetical protein V6D09_23700 [Leptolyngbyaceae cyanobacterium]